MELKIKTIEQVDVVEIIGDIDGKTAPEIQLQLQTEVRTDSKVLLDMSKVGYMSSAGLRMLLSMYRQVKEHDGRIALSGLSEEIEDIMSVTGFLEHFTTCSTVEDGVNALNN